MRARLRFFTAEGWLTPLPEERAEQQLAEERQKRSPSQKNCDRSHQSNFKHRVWMLAI